MISEFQSPGQIMSERLILRQWQQDDLEPLVTMSNDARVMEFFPSFHSREECEAMLQRIQAHHQQHGFCYWAVEIPGITRFAGFIGLAVPRFDAHFTPCVEVGWRLMPEYWGRGYATEGAAAAMRFGFETAGLDEIVSMTAIINTRSQRVMQKLGMTCNRDEDFDHPFVPPEHQLTRHVLYRIRRQEFCRQTSVPV